MENSTVDELKIHVGDAQITSGLLQSPRDPVAALVIAHGAGAGMTHPFLADFARGMAERGFATLRFQFLYMERGSRRPDSPEVAHAAVRGAVCEARKRFPKLPLFAGGKSFGGRMTSQAQALEPIEAVQGMVFLGFPLHPPGKPSVQRAEHLMRVEVPMLFLQGTRDEFAQLNLLQSVCGSLGDRATLTLFEHADHSFHVPVKSGRKNADVFREMLDTTSSWIRQIAAKT